MMKVNKPTGSNMLNPYQKKQTQHDVQSGKSTYKRDQLQISTEAKELLEAQTQVDPARQEKVNELKRQIENGQYQVSSQEVAEKMYQFWFGR